MPLLAHGSTHPGKRDVNEDALLVDPEHGLFVVADGMGGHKAGEVASALAVDVIRHSIVSAAGRGGGELEEAVREANQRVLSAASDIPDYSGMGTTVVAVLVAGSQCFFTSVGDSRLYRWRGGMLTQLTRDDTWVAAMVDTATLSATELQRHPMRHVLTEVLGARADLRPNAQVADLLNGDLLLLCSDGLHSALPSSALAAVLAGPGSLVELTDRLVADAVSNDASDNVTALLVRLET